MSAFIVLDRFYDGPVRLNVAHIESVYNSHGPGPVRTVVRTASGDEHFVSQAPADVMKFIREARPL